MGSDMDIRAIGTGLAFDLMWSSAFTSARIIMTNAPPLTVSAGWVIWSEAMSRVAIARRVRWR